MSVIAFNNTLLSTPSIASSVSFDSSFDDLPTIPAKAALEPVGIYEGISCQNFDVASLTILNESVAGLIPHSNPNTAVVGFTVTATPLLTTLYSGSKTKSFSLTSFYYSCRVKTPQGIFSVAAACIITVTGYKAGSSSPYTSQSFTFTPAEPVDVMNPLAFGKFSSKFQTLQNVTIAVSPSATTTGVFIDDLVGSTQS